MFDITTKTTDYMSIVVTHKCQLNCPFCIDAHGKTNEEINTYALIKALNFAKDKNIKDILLVGGEPTLHPNIVEIAELVKAKGFRCILTTNYCRPDIVKKLDGIVDCFNISYYDQLELPKQKDYKSDLTLSVLLWKNRFSPKEFERFIDEHKEDMHLKFSTLTICNEWTRERQYVEWLDDLPFECSTILFDEIVGQIYKGCIIKRYDKVINTNAVQSYKCHVDGTISQDW